MLDAASFNLTHSHVSTLHILAEMITPATDGFPSAREADPDDAVLALALKELRRDLPRLQKYLDTVGPTIVSTDIRSLETVDPEGFRIACELLIGRYLTCRPVWQLLGYPGRIAAPPKDGESMHYLRDDLLAPVIARGPFYTTPPS
jgi:hypothetical protein